MRKLGSDLGADGFRSLELDFAVDPTEAVPLAQAQALAGGSSGYVYEDYDKSGGYVYVGYTNSSGAWYIKRRTVISNVRQEAHGNSNYATNWTGRTGLIYA